MPPFSPDLLASSRSELLRVLTAALPLGPGREAQVAALEEDVAALLVQLDAAVQAGEPELFVRQVGWLMAMRQSRGQAPARLQEGLRALIPFFERRLPEHESAAVVAALRSVPRLPAAAEVPPPLGSETAAYAAAALAGDLATASAVFEAAARTTSYADAAVDVVQAALREVGRRWERNEVSVAQEHLATAITQRVLAHASLRAAYLPANGRRALLACVQGNRHSVGLRIVADTLETSGWEACFLGADVPTADLLDFASTRPPDLIALSLSLPEQLAPTRDAIRHLHEMLGDRCPPIWVGGLVTLRAEHLWRKLGADGWATDALGQLAPA